MDNENGVFLSVVLGAGQFEQHREDLSGGQRAPERELVERMPEFLRDDRLLLVVQPVIKLQTGKIVGAEVLSRLEHPEQGLIFPDRFIPAVEAAGLHCEFDCEIFRKSCVLMHRLRKHSVKLQYLSCNFSRMTLSEPGMPDRLCQIAEENGVPHECMAVEITEREQDTDNDQFCENLIDLKKTGFRILVDDLGAGVTSLRDMWSYPVDVVKIDRSLLLAAETEQGRSVFCRLRDLADDLGCMVLCEGVETEAQHRFVREAGCQYSQGFHFYRPMKDEQFFCLMNEING